MTSVINELCTKPKKKKKPHNFPAAPNYTYCILKLEHIEQNSPLGYWLPEILNIGKLSLLEKASFNTFATYKSKKNNLQSKRHSNVRCFLRCVCLTVRNSFIYLADNTTLQL